ncbi:MAG TPA: condensation domain-containing protein, partial [Thermoanaerobaculia bacterium]|nr:condensation domain-containing protein [Thermoanaerobaculia bacterium]
MTTRAKEVYPVTPMQEAMLFESVAATGTDVYIQQLSCRLAGELRLADFERAWQTLFDRHAVLRTAFAWRDLPQPLQVVGDQVRVPLEVVDATNVAALRERERLDGFDLGRAPLMRLKLVRLSENEHQLIWTWHHIILDAWSVPIVMEELFAIYGGQTELPPVRPYRDFVAWQRSRSLGEAETFWRAELAGFHEPTPIRWTAQNPEPPDYGLDYVQVPDAEMEALRDAARRSRLTFNTLVQGAWA